MDTWVNRALRARPADAERLRQWLATAQNSKQTLVSYKREAERFLLWLESRSVPDISCVKAADTADYFAFLRAPSPASEWIGPHCPRLDPRWRPFKGPLSTRSARQAEIILNAWFSFLVTSNLLDANPVALIKNRSHAATGVDRYLSHDLWAHLLDSIEQTVNEAGEDEFVFIQEHERAIWLMYVFYLTGARLSEIAHGSMGDFYRKRSNINGVASQSWWLKVHGKGSKDGIIPVSEELLRALSRYREFNGLPPYPASGESTPIIMDLAGKRRITPTGIYLAIRRIFIQAAASIRDQDPDGAAIFERASPHWLRHTSATHQVDAGIDIRVVSKNLRHAKIETTMLYQHAEEDMRHTETSKLKVRKK